MADITSRLVYEDRIKNVENVLKTIRDNGIINPAWVLNLLTGFAQNNRKLIFGSDYGIPKGQFEYGFPISNRL